jgi:hypothetical protein
VFRPKLFSEGLLGPLVVLDGTAVQIRGNSWEPSINVTIEDVIDITPSPSLLDDGDIEAQPGPFDLAKYGPEPMLQLEWISWIRAQYPRQDGPDGWFLRYKAKFGQNLELRNNRVYRNGNEILNHVPEQPKPSSNPGLKFTRTQKAVPRVFTSSHWTLLNNHYTVRTEIHRPPLNELHPSYDQLDDWELSWAIFESLESTGNIPEMETVPIINESLASGSGIHSQLDE